VALFVDFHGDPMPEIVRLQHGIANLATVRLTEAPDILAFHRPPHEPLATLPVGGPEEWSVRRDHVHLSWEVIRDVAVELLVDCRGQGNIASLAALDWDVPETPSAIQIADLECGHRSPSPPGKPHD